MPQHTRLSLLLLAFVVLAGVYSLVTPPFETPDEIWHYAFIQHLASGRGLPVAQPNTQELWRQQGSQAPAYYLAAAGLTAWLDQSDFRAIYGRANPHAAIGRPDAIANRNYLIHHQDEGWPWRGAILALHIARFFSILLAAATLWATYRTLALLVQPDLALAATALIGFIPHFIFISAAASNDNAINALASLTLWQIVALTVGDHAHPAFGAAADENHAGWTRCFSRFDCLRQKPAEASSPERRAANFTTGWLRLAKQLDQDEPAEAGRRIGQQERRPHGVWRGHGASSARMGRR